MAVQYLLRFLWEFIPQIVKDLRSDNCMETSQVAGELFRQKKKIFGAKISLSMVDGYAFLEELSWDVYNEAVDLKDHIEAYRSRFGCYPESVHADKIYRNRKNLNYCKDRGIALSGPPLGRPPKDPEKYRELMKGSRASEVARIPIEGKFGNGKRRYGWSSISSKLSTTSETSIYLTVLVMNLEKISRDLLLALYYYLWKLLILSRKGLVC